jgi:ribosomal protein S1
VTAAILHVDSIERRIGLSLKALKDKMEKAEVDKYVSNQEFTASNLGELIQAKMESRGEALPNKKEEE